jgi:predicted metallopeptidase
MAAVWTEASSELIHMAREIIDAYHPSLKDANVGFIFRDEAPESNGKATYAKAQKVDPKLRATGLDLDFLIWVAEDRWNQLDTNQRRALIDHELCHCYLAFGEPKMRHHDIEEFTEIIERYGFWNRDLFDAVPAVQKALQLDLGLEIRPKGAVVAIDPKQVLVEG